MVEALLHRFNLSKKAKNISFSKKHFWNRTREFKAKLRRRLQLLPYIVKSHKKDRKQRFKFRPAHAKKSVMQMTTMDARQVDPRALAGSLGVAIVSGRRWRALVCFTKGVRKDAELDKGLKIDRGVYTTLSRANPARALRPVATTTESLWPFQPLLSRSIHLRQLNEYSRR